MQPKYTDRTLKTLLINWYKAKKRTYYKPLVVGNRLNEFTFSLNQIENSKRRELI